MWKLVVLGKVTVSKVGSEEQGWDIQVLTEETAEEEVLTFTGGKEFWSALTQEVPQEGVVRQAASRPARSSPGARRPGALPARPDPLTSLPAEAPPSARAAPRGSARTCPRRRDHRSHFAAMLGPPVWALVAGVLLALSPGRAGGAPKAGRRPARARGCADRPEELLEQLYGRLAAGVLGAFHHTLQLGPREQARNASCPAGGRPADRRFRPPTNLRSVSPWAYRISYDPGRFPRYLPEAYCLCRGCLTGPHGEEDVRLRSAPVLVPAVVLRRTPGCAGGRAVYVEEYVTVPVGCTCVPGPEKDVDAANSSLDKSARP